MLRGNKKKSKERRGRKLVERKEVYRREGLEAGGNRRTKREEKGKRGKVVGDREESADRRKEGEGWGV